MARHRIGLSEAWQVRRADGDDPATWVRSFGRPSGLEETDRVLLVVEGASVAADYTLNARPLGRPEAASPRLEWDVTTLLLQRNELHVVPDGVPCPAADMRAASPAGADRRPLWQLLGAVALEIVSSDDQAVA